MSWPTAYWSSLYSLSVAVSRDFCREVFVEFAQLFGGLEFHFLGELRHIFDRLAALAVVDFHLVGNLLAAEAFFAPVGGEFGGERAFFADGRAGHGGVDAGDHFLPDQVDPGGIVLDRALQGIGGVFGEFEIALVGDMEHIAFLGGVGDGHEATVLCLGAFDEVFLDLGGVFGGRDFAEFLVVREFEFGRDLEIALHREILAFFERSFRFELAVGDDVELVGFLGKQVVGGDLDQASGFLVDIAFIAGLHHGERCLAGAESGDLRLAGDGLRRIQEEIGGSFRGEHEFRIASADVGVGDGKGELFFPAGIGHVCLAFVIGYLNVFIGSG